MFISAEETQDADESKTPSPSIVGTWIAPDSTFPYRWVYQPDGTAEKYFKNRLYKTYDWSIEEVEDETEGLIRKLTLVNHKYSDISADFKIHRLTGEKLILAYSAGFGESQSVFLRY